MTSVNAFNEKANDNMPVALGGDDGDGPEIDPLAVGGTVSDLPRGYYTSAPFIATIMGLVLCSCGAYTSYILPVNIISIVNEDLGPDPSYVWIAMVITLSISVTSVVMGRLSDVFGRRWFMIGGNLIGCLGGIIASTAQSITVLIIACAFIGMGAAIQFSFPMVVSELVPNKYRPMVIGALFFASMPFAVFGPVIARTMVEHTSIGWRSIYVLHTCVSGIAALIFGGFYFPPTYEQLQFTRTAKSIFEFLDVGGVVLFGAGMVSLIMGINWGGQQYPWKSSKVVGTIIGGVAILVTFGLYESRSSNKYPLIPMRLFRNRSYVASVVVGAVGTCVYYSFNILVPTQAGALYTTDSLHIGWLSCTIGGGALLGQMVASVLCTPLGRHRLQLVFFSCWMTAFVGALASTTASTESMFVAFTVLGAFGVGYIELVVNTTAALCLDPKDIGLASGVLLSARTGVPTIATAIYVSILGNKLSSNIPAQVIPAIEEAGLPPTSIPAFMSGLIAGNFTSVPGITPLIIEAGIAADKSAYSDSFQVVYLVSIAFGACCIIAALLSPNLEHMFTDNIARRLQGHRASERDGSSVEDDSSANLEKV